MRSSHSSTLNRTKTPKVDLLYRLYRAVGYLRAAREILRKGERGVDRAWNAINHDEWRKDGWTKRRIAALQKQRRVEHEEAILRDARAILKRRRGLTR
jgi:hypothetical protein